MTSADLARLHAACFTMPRPWSEAEFADLLASPLIFLIAEPAGFALGRVVADEGELLTLAVDPAARRRGTGRRLLTAFEAEAAARGAASAFLEVAAGNDAARALYLSAGYALTGLRRGYFRDGAGGTDDAQILSRGLGLAGADRLTKR
jgi:[ribosomal protein S18]-alanine N-acetyltransferase